MTEEFQGTGSYGKEDLSQEGIYVYITEIDRQEDQTVVFAEKYSTLKNAEAIGLEMTFSKAKKSWRLNDKKVDWKERDTPEEKKTAQWAQDIRQIRDIQFRRKQRMELIVMRPSLYMILKHARKNC